jgi:DNA-binding Lrp family transcriptional regulator
VSAEKKILHNFGDNPTASISFIANSLKIPRTTVSDVIKRFGQTLTIDKAPTLGRPKGPVDKKLSKKILNSIKVNPGLSDGDRGKNMEHRAGIFEELITKQD